MSWLYSRVLVEEYLGDIFWDGEQSVQSSGSNTQQAYCAPDKMTSFSRLSRFGMTYKPLTEDLGEELLTLFRGAFPVRTLVPQEKEQALQETDRVCGNTWPGLLAKYNPNTHLWKTAQCSLFEDLELSLETFPRWGSMRNGELFQREILVLPILENESGLLQQMWPTPVCQDSRHATTRHLDPNNQYWKSNLGEVVMSTEQTGIPGRLNPTWVEWLMGWPLGWTDLKPLEMDKFQEWQQQHGNYLHKETNDSTLD